MKMGGHVSEGLVLPITLIEGGGDLPVGTVVTQQLGIRRYEGGQSQKEPSRPLWWMRHPMLIDHRSPKEKTDGTPQVVIRVTNLGDSAITLRAWAWAATPGNAFVMKCDLLKSIKERFDRENIEIPYPYFNQIVTTQKS